MEQTTGRRGGGCAARQAARTARAIDSVPFLTPPLDDSIDAELADWIGQRKASFPDSDG